MMSRTCAVYGLRSPDSDQIVYIGRTRDPEIRLKAHVSAAIRKDRGCRVENWVGSLLADGKYPVMVILEDNIPDRWIKDKEAAWIYETMLKQPLLNTNYRKNPNEQIDFAGLEYKMSDFDRWLKEKFAARAKRKDTSRHRRRLYEPDKDPTP